jgi:hypothetical protein
MQKLLIAIWACALITLSACVAPDEESTLEGAIIDDFGEPDNHHCPTGAAGVGVGPATNPHARSARIRGCIQTSKVANSAVTTTTTT